jgi:hypothetical protein
VEGNFSFGKEAVECSLGIPAAVEACSARVGNLEVLVTLGETVVQGNLRDSFASMIRGKYNSMFSTRWLASTQRRIPSYARPVGIDFMAGNRQWQSGPSPRGLAGTPPNPIYCQKVSNGSLGRKGCCIPGITGTILH